MVQQPDAIIVGAGHNGLTCACYLAKAGLKVLVLEAYHTIGGMAITDEVTLPGFKSDIHAYGYQFANMSPVPDELGLAEFGFELIKPDPAFSHVFPDGGIVSVRRDVEQTIESIAAYSPKDAAAWRMVYNGFLAAKDQVIAAFHNPPFLLSEQAAIMEQTPGGMDLYRASLQSLRSWCNEWFEADQTKVLFGSWVMHGAIGPDDAGGGNAAWLFGTVIQHWGNNLVRGGMQNLPRALAQYLEKHGGEIRVNHRVRRIIVADGRASGVELEDGEQITATKVIAACVHPQQLALDLLGTEHVGTAITTKLRRYEHGDAAFGMYLALDGPVHYKAGPEATRAGYVHASPASLDAFARVYLECRGGLLPAEPLFIIGNDSNLDPGRAPAGKCLVKILVSSVPYEIKGDATGRMSGRHWDEVKDQYAAYLVDLLTEKYIPDLKAKLLKCTAYSPLDFERGISSAIRGTLAHGAFVPYQLGGMRPIPELAHYRTPIANVYACGAGNHPGPGISMAPGYNAAQVILASL